MDVQNNALPLLLTRRECTENEGQDAFALTRNTSTTSVLLAGMEHLPAAKRLSDRHKRELGFVNQAILRKAIETKSLLIAERTIDGAQEGTEVVGLVHFYIRRDHIITLYSIAVAQACQRTGLGRQLFTALVNEARIHGKSEILLKCPTELPANLFYERLGLEKINCEPGKQRPLNLWKYVLGNV